MLPDTCPLFALALNMCTQGPAFNIIMFLITHQGYSDVKLSINFLKINLFKCECMGVKNTVTPSSVQCLCWGAVIGISGDVNTVKRERDVWMLWWSRPESLKGAWKLQTTPIATSQDEVWTFMHGLKSALCSVPADFPDFFLFSSYTSPSLTLATCISQSGPFVTGTCLDTSFPPTQKVPLPSASLSVVDILLGLLGLPEVEGPTPAISHLPSASHPTFQLLTISFHLFPRSLDLQFF